MFSTFFWYSQIISQSYKNSIRFISGLDKCNILFLEIILYTESEKWNKKMKKKYQKIVIGNIEWV